MGKEKRKSWTCFTFKNIHSGVNQISCFISTAAFKLTDEYCDQPKTHTFAYTHSQLDKQPDAHKESRALNSTVKQELP